MSESTSTAARTKSRVLIVDEDPIMSESIAKLLTSRDCEAAAAATMGEAVALLNASRFNVVLAGVRLADRDGFDLLRFVSERHPGVPVILLDDCGTVESAVAAMREGAQDYLTKPINTDEVRAAVGRILQQQRSRSDAHETLPAQWDRIGLTQIIAQDYRMSKVLDLVDTVAAAPTTVLITGESGTGKSLIARAIHARSPRAAGPFVEVACGALSETLLESELFGHVRGAFTHAINDKPGKFAAADTGTIFLDEISTASPQLQIKLLRVLQERRFEPVGSNETQSVDVRVILATNHDLAGEVENGRFRKDLYYRINVVNIELPPLRQRESDIPLLTEGFLRRFNESGRKHILGFSAEAMERMRQYHWPGNIRELENCVERAVVLSRSAYISAEDLPPAILQATTGSDRAAHDDAASGTLRKTMLEAERRIIASALEANGGNRGATAGTLGINRTTLYKKMKRHGLM